MCQTRCHGDTIRKTNQPQFGRSSVGPTSILTLCAPSCIEPHMRKNAILCTRRKWAERLPFGYIIQSIADRGSVPRILILVRAWSLLSPGSGFCKVSFTNCSGAFLFGGGVAAEQRLPNRACHQWKVLEQSFESRSRRCYSHSWPLQKRRKGCSSKLPDHLSH